MKIALDDTSTIKRALCYLFEDRHIEHKALLSFYNYYCKRGDLIPVQLNAICRIINENYCNLFDDISFNRFVPKELVIKRNTTTPENSIKLNDKASLIVNRYKDLKMSKRSLKNKLPTEIYNKLFPYQKQGLKFIESRKGRVLLADSMGLGKSCMSLCYIELHPELRPAVIVVPASLKLNWVKEVKMWTTKNNKTVVLNGKKPYDVSADIYIINYDILGTKNGDSVSGWCEYLNDKKPQIIINDECHFFKSSKSLRTKAVMKLTAYKKHLIFISGTPILNRPMEIFNSVKRLESSLFSDWWSFGMRYCDPQNNGFGMTFNGATNTEELYHILTNTFMLRRLKEDVLKQLPPKTKSIVPFKIDNRKEYNNYEFNFLKTLAKTSPEKAEKASKAEGLVQISYLKQKATEGKIKEVIKWIENFVESGEKAIEFIKKQCKLIYNII